VLVEFTLLRDRGKARIVFRTLNFRKANFQLFKQLVRKTPWEMVLRNRGTEQNWHILLMLLRLQISDLFLVDPTEELLIQIEYLPFLFFLACKVISEDLTT